MKGVVCVLLLLFACIHLIRSDCQSAECFGTASVTREQAEESHSHHIPPFKPNITLVFDWEAGGSYIAFGGMVGVQHNVDTGDVTAISAPNCLFAIDPPTQRFTFQDDLGNFWYTSEHIYVYLPAFGNCFYGPGNYSAVIAAYKETANIANPIQPAGVVREYSGLISDPSQCRLRNIINMQTRADGTVYQWGSDQLFGFKDPGTGKVIQRLVSKVAYTYPTITHGVNDTLFNLPAPCNNPLPATAFCDTFYWTYW